MNSFYEHPTRIRKKIVELIPTNLNQEKNRSIKKVSVILKKAEEDRTAEENEYLFKYSEIAKEAASRLERREQLKQREKEFEDSDLDLDEKCAQLAEALSRAKYLVVYTGAGISTAARIPDYRGASGIWTLLQQGKDIGEHDLTQAEPTYTHMALSEMFKQGRIKHIVSQNCDGLHLRSGLTRRALSELHGNMYIEVCRSCRPFREYLRLFDVTENTARFSHRTYRRCYQCQSPLVDSIVHFGERGNMPWPLNWKGACRAAENADVILCLGSSLKVLKRYPWLWSMDKPAKRRPKLYIVNLQWTPKDCQAALKIHGKCDAVMRRIMKFLGIEVPEYKREKDPIFWHATSLCTEEKHTTNRASLQPATEELIVITVAADDKSSCCDLFAKQHNSHEKACRNYCEKTNDIPVILQPPERSPADLSVLPPPPGPSFPFIEGMFFNYLFSVISSLTSYNYPPMSSLPIASTSQVVRPLALLPGPVATDFGAGEPPAKIPRLTAPPPPPVVACSFCQKHFSANGCDFYTKYEASFPPDKTPCLCCDDDEDEEEENADNENGDDENDDQDVDGDDKKLDGADDKSGEAKSSSNPGWYGKGYRKKLKKKR